MSKRQLFLFWQFNGDNHSYCNLHCPECYGKDGKTYQHCWNGKTTEWEQAFTRLDKQHGSNGIEFVFSYGEALGSHGFLDCVEMIGRHPTWTLTIVTNLMLSPEPLLQTRLAKEHRVFIIASWHPEGVQDIDAAWGLFVSHLLELKKAGIKTHVMCCWFPPVFKRFPEWFRILDSLNIRVGLRRYVGAWGGVHIPPFHRLFFYRKYPRDYTPVQRKLLEAFTCAKVLKYGVNLQSPKGKSCTAGKDMLLVKCDGEARLCADCENSGPVLGNIFNPDFKLNSVNCVCPSTVCGGDYGMLHVEDPEFGALPERLIADTFLSQVEGVEEGAPVAYPKRGEILECLKKL